MAGYIEALCVRLPEVTGSEVVDLVPELARAVGFEDAFRRSLTWRDVQTLSGRTRALVLERLGPTRAEARGWCRYCLRLRLFRNIRSMRTFLTHGCALDAMPERDAWWSASLPGPSSTAGPARRLLDWALGLEPSVPLDDEVVTLSALSLSWLLTAPDPGVRNMATRALVNLLAGRIAATIRLVQRFTAVDDPSVLQRVYAVAYGVATRSYDAGGSG